MQTALESFFRVGEAGGKTLDRFDELMKVRLVGRCSRAGVTLLSAWWQYCTCRYSTLKTPHILMHCTRHSSRSYPAQTVWTCSAHQLSVHIAALADRHTRAKLPTVSVT